MEPQGIRLQIVRNVPMKRYTSMKVGGPAPYLIYPEDEGGVQEAVAWLRGRGLPFRFLGNGTNVIVSDRGLDGGLIRMTRMRHLRFKKTETGALVEAGGGLSLKALIRAAAARGLAGVERLFGIPGTVGGAIKMNAGSFGVAISDCLISVKYVDEENDVRTIGRDRMGFAYRSSPFSDGACILEATLELVRADHERIKADMEYVWRERIDKHPMDLASAGSVFKNGNGVPSWRYIDRAGLRGLRIGNACVSERHPNFIVNMGGTSASDIKRLIETVKKGVAEATGVALETEVELWGFDDDA
ncbi:MAG: UDP-N-acetylmuramate dehydrogenase [Syntrophorhabdales bacterium]